MNKMRLFLATILTIIGATFNSTLLNNSAQAACAVAWVFDDETVNFCNGTSEGGTFSSKLEQDSNNNTIVTITLNNYKGQVFHPESFGSGIEVSKYIVNLIGSNEITLDNSNRSNEFTYELTGNGQLTIKAANQSTDCISTLPDNVPIKDSSNNEALPDDALIGPTKPMDIWDIITWFAVRIVIFGSFIAIGVFITLGVIWLRNQKSSHKSRKPSKKR